ncbi:MAG: hypothetical protein RLY87_2545 [Chloroflexota bacterium]
MSLPNINRYRSLLTTYFWPQRRQVTLLVLLIIGDNILLLVGPRVLSQFVDAAVAGAASDVLVWLSIWYLIAAISQQAFTMSATYVGEKTGWQAANALRSDLAKHTLDLDMSFHKKQTPGIMIERIDGDVASLNRFFSQMVLQIGGSILLLTSTVGVLMWTEWRLGVLLLGYAVVAMWVLFALRGVAVPYWESAREASAQLFGFLEERLAGLEDIRGLGARSYVLRRLVQLMDEKNKYDTLGRVYGSLTWMIPVVLSSLLTVMVLTVGVWLYLQNEITIGLIVMTMFYGDMIMRPIRTISSEIDQLQQATAGISRIAELLSIKSRLVDGVKEMPAQIPPVTFDHVTFAYQDDEDGQPEEPVLRDVTFHIPAGKVVGLLGRTGSGKSTLIRLLFRLYDVSSGAIRIGDHAIPDYTLASLRTHVGLVTQDVQLFYATVRDNLTFFNPAIRDEQLLEALHTLGLDRWFAQQPNGLDTLLAANGATSAGEAQLIALARVYLKQPQVIILDEASARIDPETERMVEKALDTVLADKTTIIIAHRLQTVRRCDYIAILANGSLVEFGPEAALREQADSRYAQLLQHGAEQELA